MHSIEVISLLPRMDELKVAVRANAASAAATAVLSAIDDSCDAGNCYYYCEKS